VTPEAEVMRFIRNFFMFDRGIYLTRNNVGAVKRGNRYVHFGAPGESDWRGVVDKTFCPFCGKQTGRGVALFIEAKAAKGRLSAPQKEFLGAMRRLGAVAVVAQPVPAEDDPTGYRALRRTLERIRDRACAECQAKKDETQKGRAENGEK